MNTVIFGGSFNPIHNGHLQMALAAANDGMTDKLLILPDHIPPHKSIGDDFAPADDRRAMCELFSKLVPRSEVCDVELRRGGKSYMYDTVCELEGLYPSDSFSILVGGDMVMTLDSWHRADDLLKKVGVLAIGRDTVGEDELQNKISELSARGVKIRRLAVDTDAVSSTEVRERLKRGFTDVPVPETVLRYIVSHGLYRKGETNA